MVSFHKKSRSNGKTFNTLTYMVHNTKYRMTSLQ